MYLHVVVILWDGPQQTVGFQQSILVGLSRGIRTDHLGYSWNACLCRDQGAQQKSQYMLEVHIVEIVGKQKMQEIWPCIKGDGKRRCFAQVCFLLCSYSCPGSKDALLDESTDGIVPGKVGSIVY